MPRPNLRKLPERERRETLTRFLDCLDRHPNLEHFRAAVPPGSQRQLALFAALERSALRGSPAVAPPSPQDHVDQLLCDLLDVIDQHPELKNHGTYYGADRHMATLQALGAWSARPLALELFTTAFSHLNPDAASNLPSSITTNSPALQVSSQNGELIAAATNTTTALSLPEPSPQIVDGTLIRSHDCSQANASNRTDEQARIHHASPNAGEQLDNQSSRHPGAPGCAVALTRSASEGLSPSSLTPTADPRLPTPDSLTMGPSPSTIPPRPIRRGRPPVLDDLAKGRLLGLMSHGLSFRQAAAQLGVHHVTILNLMKRDEQFAQQVAEARLDAISQPLLTVIHASRTNWRAAAWLAKFLNDRRASTYETTPEEYELQRKRS